jgi:AraC-like DNA-binding protein
VLSIDAITHVPAVLRGLGLDPAALIAATGLAPRVFDDPLNEIPVTSLGRLLALASKASGCGHVGLLIGRRSGTASLGLLGSLVRHSPDVGTALRNLTSHLHLRDRGAVAPLLVTNGIASLGYEIYQQGVEAGDQICDGSLAIAMNVMRELCGAAWRPMEVRFAHRPPAQRAPFRLVFDAPLRFNAERSALVFPASWLEHRTPGADPELHAVLTRRVAALERAQAHDLVDDLRRMLREMLLSGRGSVGDAARRLSLHRRTLNRRLRARGTSLRRLLGETRFETARQLVENTRLPLTEIAATLGYADASGFTRAFQRWTGAVPSAWRRKHAWADVANCQAAARPSPYAAAARQRRRPQGGAR